MTRIELLRLYDMLDDCGKYIVDTCILVNLEEMLREESIEENEGGEEK